jgi:Flp pilus assembly protein TadD
VRLHLGSPGSAWALFAVLALAACAAPAPIVGDLSPADRAAYAQGSLERVRVLRSQGDLKKAERLLRSVIAVAPDDRRARVLHIQLLEEMGRTEDAARARHEARVFESPPIPRGPANLASEGVLVTIAAQELGDGGTSAQTAVLGEPMAVALAARVETRLPKARVIRGVPDTVEEARGWLTRIHPRAVLALRVARGFCSESVKDGAFAMTELLVASGPAGADELDRFSHIERLYDPSSGACVEEVAARALEQVLRSETVRRALASEGGAQRWSSVAVREIFPGLDAAIETRAERGRAAMEKGRFGEALALFREASALDPEDVDLANLMREAEATLAMQREIRRERGTFVADTAAEAAASLAGGE